jgi:DNA-binding transcriptional ArsR family regulator
MTRRNVHHVRGKALEVLASARRLELVEALMSEQPATVEELGRHLGRDPKTLYHHLRPLVAAGLVVEDGERPTSKRPATVYRLPAERLEVDPTDTTPRARAQRRKIARSALRSALTLQERAIEDPDNVLGGRGRNVVLGHRVARLTPGGVARVNAKLREVYGLLGELHDERGRPYAFTASLAPVSRGDS